MMITVTEPRLVWVIVLLFMARPRCLTVIRSDACVSLVLVAVLVTCATCQAAITAVVRLRTHPGLE